jgi:ribonuclease HI
MNRFEIFSDGSCLGNPGPGGWGSIIRTGSGKTEKVTELSGGKAMTTNNEMELIAVIEALRKIKKPSEISVTSDSQYVVKGMTSWIGGWIKNGWKTSSKKPVKNRALWEDLHRLSTPHKVDWIWIRGHTGHAENERCDRLANEAASQQR